MNVAVNIEHIEYQVRVKLNPGIYRSDRDAHWAPRAYPYSEGGREQAEAKLAELAVELPGSFGNIGCGDGGALYISATVGPNEYLWRLDGDNWVPVDDDGDEADEHPVTIDDLPDEADDPLTDEERSEILRAAITPRWNGNNHVSLLSEETPAGSYRDGHVTVEWSPIHGLNLDIDAGWTVAWEAWGDARNGILGHLSATEVEALLQRLGVEYDHGDATTYDGHGQPSASEWFVVRDEAIPVITEALKNDED